NLAVAQHLDDAGAVANLADTLKRINVYGFAIFKPFQCIKVDDVNLFTEDVSKTDLGKTPDERHLSAFESAAIALAAPTAGLGALVSVAGGFAEAASLAASETLATFCAAGVFS